MADDDVDLDDFLSPDQRARLDEYAKSAEALKGQTNGGGGKPAAVYPLKWHGETDSTPLREQLVAGMLPKIGKALLSGQWGVYKTFVAIDLAGSIMTMTAFAGHAVKLQGGVLLVAAEGQDEVRPRLEGLAREKIATLEAPEGAVRVDPTHMPFTWVEACPRLTTDTAFEELRTIVEVAKAEMQQRFGLPLVLVILDALMPAAGFKDANDASEAERVMDALDKFARVTGLLVLIVDHFGKDVSTGTRNSSVKEDAVEAVLALIADRDLAGKVTNQRVAIRKLKGGRTGDEISFQPRLVTIYENAGYDAITTLVVDWEAPKPDGAPAANARREWPKSLKIFLKALDFALTNSGERTRPFLDGPEVLAVKRDLARHEFMKIYPADNHASKDKAFRRCEQSAIAGNLMGSRDVGPLERTTTVFWKL
jgi:hypothetical protein